MGHMIAKSTCAVAMLGLLVFVTPATADEPKAELGKKAPDFTLPDTAGKDVSLHDYEGKIVVLEWINQQCPISAGKHDDRTMQKLAESYGEKGVVWLAIDSSHYCDRAKNAEYAEKKGIKYPILQDPEGTVGREYGARTTPHMYVIDKQGILVYAGAIDDKHDKNYVAVALDDVLAGREVGTPKTQPYGCSVKYKKK
jgi:peroxiredoxin